jgi:dTDP-4-dehydrorhamnose 3,5-epimerase
MQVIETSIQDAFKIKSDIYEDSRGFFFEAFNQKKFEDIIKQNINFVQDNHSKSARNVLRGLHYQFDQVQAKLVRVTQGEVFDVIVDLRKHSNTFGQWEGHTLSAENKEQLWIPKGCAHGFSYFLILLKCYIKQLITMHLNLSAVLSGTIKRLTLNGQFNRNQFFLPKIA